MNRVLFIQEDIFPKLGAMYVSNVFRKHGWEVECLVSSQEKNIVKKIREIRPQVAGFSLTSGEYDAWGRSMTRLVKEHSPGTIVILGGSHATYFPEVIEDDGVDMVCIGEGEQSVKMFCERWDRGENIEDISGFWFKKDGTVFKNDVNPLISELDSIPFPDRALYSRYPFISRLSYSFVITSRGCPYKCSFCYNDSFLRIFKDRGKIVRRRSVDNVINEIGELRRLFPWTRSVCFVDDIFWCDMPKGWMNEFSAKYRERAGLPFSCSVFAKWINDDTARLLKESGCFGVKMGLESGNQRVRREILKKDITDADIYRASESLHKHKIDFLTYNMLGIPTENYQDALNTYEMNLKIKPMLGWCSLLNPYKGTSIADIAKREGSLPESFEFSYSYFGGTPLVFDRKKDIMRLQKFFPVGIFFNIPANIAGWITRNIRIDFIYNLFFIMFYSLLIGKITGFTLRDITIVGAHTKIFRYFGGSKESEAGRCQKSAR